MKITRNINTTIVSTVVLEVEDGHPEMRAKDTEEFVQIAHVEQ